MRDWGFRDFGRGGGGWKNTLSREVRYKYKIHVGIIKTSKRYT